MSIAAVQPTPLPPPISDDCGEPEVTLEMLKRFTVDEYHAMIKAGVFDADENFELLEGWIVHKMPKYPPHWIATDSLADALRALGLIGFFVHAQNPVTTKDSEPEPDVAIIRGQRRDYRDGNPDPKEAPLLVEVADSSLSRDRRWKKRIYARARVPVYWIVNIPDRQVEIYTQPSGPVTKPTYKNCEIVTADGDLPVVIDGREVGRIAVKDILP